MFNHTHNHFNQACSKRHGQLIAAFRTKYKNPKIANISYLVEKLSFSIVDCFVDLSFILHNKQYQSLASLSEVVQLQQLFEPITKGQVEEKTTRLLIEGPAGSGKTTVNKFLANRWAEEDKVQVKNLLERFKVVILVPLRLLNYCKLNADNLLRFIYEQCLGKTKELSFEDFSKTLIELEASHSVLYLLDGYDEVLNLIDETEQGDYGNDPTGRSRMLQELFEKSAWLLTSRPGFAMQNTVAYNKHITMKEFSDRNISEYIKKYFLNFNEPKRGKGLKKYMKENPSIRNIAKIPICIELICTIWKDNQWPVLSEKYINITQLYINLSAYLFGRYLQDRCCVNVSKLVSEEFENHDKCVSYVRYIQEFAWQLTEQRNLIFKPDLNLLKCSYEQEEMSQVLENIFVHIGLFNMEGDPKRNIAKNEFSFIHDTFRSFFAAKYWIDLYKSNKEKAMDIFKDKKCHPSYRLVWRFVAGLQIDARKEFLMYLVRDSEVNLYFDNLQILIIVLCETNDVISIKQHRHLIKKWIGYILNDNNNISLVDRTINLLNNYPILMKNISLMDEINTVKEKFNSYILHFVVGMIAGHYEVDKNILDYFVDYFKKNSSYHYKYDIQIINEIKCINKELVDIVISFLPEHYVTLSYNGLELRAAKIVVNNEKIFRQYIPTNLLERCKWYISNSVQTTVIQSLDIRDFFQPIQEGEIVFSSGDQGCSGLMGKSQDKICEITKEWLDLLRKQLYVHLFSINEVSLCFNCYMLHYFLFKNDIKIEDLLDMLIQDISKNYGISFQELNDNKEILIEQLKVNIEKFKMEFAIRFEHIQAYAFNLGSIREFPNEYLPDASRILDIIGIPEYQDIYSFVPWNLCKIFYYKDLSKCRFYNINDLEVSLNYTPLLNLINEFKEDLRDNRESLPILRMIARKIEIHSDEELFFDGTKVKIYLKADICIGEVEFDRSEHVDLLKKLKHISLYCKEKASIDVLIEKYLKKATTNEERLPPQQQFHY